MLNSMFSELEGSGAEGRGDSGLRMCTVLSQKFQHWCWFQLSSMALWLHTLMCIIYHVRGRS